MNEDRSVFMEPSAEVQRVGLLDNVTISTTNNNWDLPEL